MRIKELKVRQLNQDNISKVLFFTFLNHQGKKSPNSTTHKPYFQQNMVFLFFLKKEKEKGGNLQDQLKPKKINPQFILLFPFIGNQIEQNCKLKC